MYKTHVNIALLAALCIALVGLSACDSGTTASSGPTAASIDPGPGGSTTQEAALTEGTVIVTIGDSPVYWPEYRYWLKFITDYYKEANDLEAITDWTAEQDGLPLEQFFLQAAVDYAGRHRALEMQSEEFGLEVSQAELDEIAATRADNIRVYGSEAEYLRIVSRAYISEDVYVYLVRMGYLSNRMFTELYGPNGERCTDEDVTAYVAEQGLMCARYVFRSFAASGAEGPSEADKVAHRELLEELLRRLDASEDPVALFASLAAEHNQDARALNYPDGVLFVAGGMGQEFEDVFATLEENQYGGIVESPGGLYLIMRLPVDPDMAVDTGGTPLRYRAAYDYLYKRQVDAWYAALDVEYALAYDSLDLETFIH